VIPSVILRSTACILRLLPPWSISVTDGNPIITRSQFLKQIWKTKRSNFCLQFPFRDHGTHYSEIQFTFTNCICLFVPSSCLRLRNGWAVGSSLRSGQCHGYEVHVTTVLSEPPSFSVNPTMMSNTSGRIRLNKLLFLLSPLILDNWPKPLIIRRASVVLGDLFVHLTTPP